MTTWYEDADSDGYGVTTSTLTACDGRDSGYADNADDCDDTDDAVNPAAREICDSIDNDCDGDTDDDDTDVDPATASEFFTDADLDGYGDPTTRTTACVQPSGTVTDNTDCNDGDAAISPGASEVCDSIDNDCDTEIDDCLLYTSDAADE